MTWRAGIAVLLLAGALLSAAGCPQPPMHVYPLVPHGVELRDGAAPRPP